MKDDISAEQQEADEKQKDSISQNNKKNKQPGTTKIGLIVGVIAIIVLLIFGFSPIGIILTILAICFVVPELIIAIKSKKLPENNAGIFLAGAAISIIAVIVSIVSTVNMIAKENNNRKPEIQQEYSSLEKLDLNGLTVNEACTKLREIGWKIGGVTNGQYGDTHEKSDCSDTIHKVSTVNYHDEKYSEYTGKVNENYETVFIEFNSDNSKDSSNSTENNSKSSSTNVSTTDNNSATSSNTDKTPSSNSSEWRQFLQDYEAWMNSYVDFMKKYKNASSSEIPSMLNDYANMLEKSQEWTKRADDIKGSISSEDMAEYLRTLSRITQKLSEIY